MNRRLVVLAALVLTAPVTARAQELSVERIFGTAEYSSDLEQLRWDDARHFTTVRSDDGRTTDLVRVAARSGDREVLVRGADLVPPGGVEPITIQDYAFSSDRSKLLIYTDVQSIWRYSSKGHYYVWDFESEKLVPVSREPGYQQYAKFSPDGRRVAFVRDHNLFVTDLSTGRERALTTDGSETVINGTSDWVYEEELVLYDGFRWSPDGSRIAFWRFDQSPIEPFTYLVDHSHLYPKLHAVRYPKAGTDNSKVRLGVVEVGTGSIRWIDAEVQNDGYLARMDFAGSSDEIWIQRLNRHQSRMDLLLADAESGVSRVVMTDEDEAWLDIHEPIWIDGGKRFLYLSERDGYARPYLYRRDGSPIRRLTEGEYDVLELHGVDEDAGVVYFTSARDGPLGRPLYRIGLDGRALKKISREPGTHDVSFAPDFGMYVDIHSRAGVPPAQRLHAADGSEIRTIAENAALRRKVESLALPVPEFIKVPAADGETELNAWIIKPRDFDPLRRYPLLLYVYGGPGSQTVRDRWDGRRYLWHQLLASEGYLVASVDNRGTGARGSEFMKMTYLKLGQIETEDQIAAAEYFASLDHVDGERIGIWGWSYGGYMTLLAMFRGAEVFSLGISGAPVTDWRLYDTIYTERYMRTPDENPTGYERGAPLSYADRLSGDLLIIHGTGDDNVHFQNTVQLIDRLETAGKQFDMRIYPNRAHAIGGPTAQVNLFTMLTNYVTERL